MISEINISIITSVTVSLISGLIGAIIGAILGPYFSHKLSVKYMKKELFFKEKLKIFEKIVAYNMKNLVALGELEVVEEKNEAYMGYIETIRQQITRNIFEISSVIEKTIYIPLDLMKSLEKYISLFHKFASQKDLQNKIKIKELRENSKPYVKEIENIITREIKDIK